MLQSDLNANFSTSRICCKVISTAVSRGEKMNTFDHVWNYLQKNLTVGTTIKNWTAFRGYLGDTMTVVGIRKNYIDIDTSNAGSLQVVPKGDFEQVWKVWLDYKNKKVRRYELRDMTRFSKYIISILHWYENA
jgi:hypothetical protein